MASSSLNGPDRAAGKSESRRQNAKPEDRGEACEKRSLGLGVDGTVLWLAGDAHAAGGCYVRSS